jgi:Bacterial pre-peptidase C-terminal domain
MTDNSLSKARTLGVLGSRTVARRDLVGPSDRLDFYKFTLRRSSNVKFLLSGLRANADLLIFNRLGKAIARSKRGSTITEQISRQLTAGTYYVQVLNRSKAGTRYRLAGSVVSGVGGGGGSTPAGTRANPIDLGLLTGIPVGRSQDVAGGFEAPKVYKFQLGQISDVSIALSQVAGGGTMRLYYDTNRNGQFDLSDNSTIDSGEGSESSNRPISSVLPATGTYFLEVSRDFQYNTMVYNLAVNTTPVPGNIPTDPGSEPTTAYNLGTLNRGGRLEAKDYVGRIDSTDIYRFNLSETSNVTFGRLDVAGDINVEAIVYQDKNNNNLLELNEFIGQIIGNQGSTNLQAGSYYLSVKQSNVSNTAYTVTISA